MLNFPHDKKLSRRCFECQRTVEKRKKRLVHLKLHYFVFT
jgi:hypothetical protein